jgi:hypothetical protein
MFITHDIRIDALFKIRKKFCWHHLLWFFIKKKSFFLHEILFYVMVLSITPRYYSRVGYIFINLYVCFFCGEKWLFLIIELKRYIEIRKKILYFSQLFYIYAYVWVEMIYRSGSLSNSNRITTSYHFIRYLQFKLQTISKKFSTIQFIIILCNFDNR